MKTLNKYTLGAVIFAAGIMSVNHEARAGAFTAGDLVVDQVGTGTGTLGSTGTAVFLDEFTVSGTVVQSIALATDGSSIVQSGSATSEGLLHFSADGSSLLIPGYNVVAGTAGVASATSTAVPRAIAEFNLNGTQTSVTQLGTAFSGNNIRSAAGASASNLFAAGGNTGVVSATAGTNGSAVVSATTTNNRDVNVFGGNLYFDSGSGTTARGLYEITGTSAAVGQTITQVLATGSSSSPYGFSVSTDGLTAYVADSGGTLTKYTRATATGTFALAYSLTIASGVTSVAVSYGTTNTIYFDNPTTVFSATDNGTAFGTTINTLDTAATNTAFRGLDIVPVPEPATWAAGVLSALMLAWALTGRSRRLFGIRGA